MKPNPFAFINKHLEKDEEIPVNLDCYSCEGSGIVWG